MTNEIKDKQITRKKNEEGMKKKEPKVVERKDKQHGNNC